MDGLLLSSLGEGVSGGRLMLEYQKSLPAQHALTQTANSNVGIYKFSAVNELSSKA